MKVLKIVQLLTVFLLLSAFSIPGKHSKKPVNKPPLFDTSIIAVIPYSDTTFCSSFLKGKPAELTNADITATERIFKKAVQEYQPLFYSRDYRMIVKEYKRQYVAVYNEQGEKIVLINCFCAAGPSWKKRFIMVMDGGDCYFSLMINLTTKKYYGFMVNGTA